LTIFREASIAISLRKDLKVRDRVAAIVQRGVDSEFGTKSVPDDPGMILGGGALSTDGKSSGLRSKAEVSAERIDDLRGTSCQG
jgi:hypothetical protein